MITGSLLHYENLELIGAGGMGEVYRARDSKLGRDVAIKILPGEMSRDPERLARFEREARTLATLQHTNIASVYGFETADTIRLLIMELVGGEDLSEHLRHGPLAIEEAVNAAVQLAEGLEAAHAVGIIHRDLKPANLKLSSEGKLKILDFGLARAFTGDQGADSNMEHSPTITSGGMTQAGVILGTAAYMAPEQARGKRVDHRADIWAFGVVLFEMLTGQRLFEGETVSDTLAGVLRADMPWDRLPKGTPPTLRNLLERCLERDPSRRLQAIAEARIVLEDLKAGRSDAPLQRVDSHDPSRFRRERGLWIIGMGVLMAALTFVAINRDSAPDQPLTRSTLLPPTGWDFAPASPLAVSPDGSAIAYVVIARPENQEAAVGSNSMWIQDLAQSDPRKLADVDSNAYPFWSPDGQWLGFFADGSLNKIEARGGPVVRLCDASDGRGGTWNAGGTIIFQRAWSEGLMKIAAGGGSPETVTTLNKDRIEIAHRWPHFLPDGRHFLFYVVSTTNPFTSEASGIYVGSLDSSECELLLRSESRAVYAHGYLLYRVGSTLMAHPFDASSRRFTGDPTPLATDIPGGAISWGGALFGASESGLLVHIRGVSVSNTRLQWRGRDGEVQETVAERDGYWEASLSHDGTRIAVSIGQTAGDIWVLDLERDLRTRFTFDTADDRYPLWSPDDSQLAFSSTRTVDGEIYLRPTSGQEDAKRVFAAETSIELSHWSNDGSLIFFDRIDPENGGSDVWTLNLNTLKAAPLLSGRFTLTNARLSPDGKWLAFVSDESGRPEVYVQPFPEGAGRWMISSDGGASPAKVPSWRGDGHEIYYMRGDALMAISVAVEGTFSFGTPKALFTMSTTTASTDYAVSEDGQRILTNEIPPTDPGNIGARLVQNWPRALER